MSAAELVAEVMAEAERRLRRAEKASAAALAEVIDEDELDRRLAALRPDRYHADDLTWAAPVVREMVAAADLVVPDYDERCRELVAAQLAVSIAERLAELVEAGQAIAVRDDAGRVVFRRPEVAP